MTCCMVRMNVYCDFVIGGSSECFAHAGMRMHGDGDLI